MYDLKNGYLNLTELIADSLELYIFKEIDIFEHDARDGLVNYIYCEKIDDIDEDRYK